MGEPRSVLHQRWTIPSGEIALIITTDRALTAAVWDSLGPVADEIGSIAAELVVQDPGDARGSADPSG